MYTVPLMVTGKACGRAKLTATSRMKPAISEIQIELTMPFGAEIRASIVSSETWAEASYPVKVYCAFKRPMRNT